MISQILLPEYDHEMNLTRKVLSRVDWSKKDWKPHEKSMSMGTLSGHLAEINKWVVPTLKEKELDMSKTPYLPPVFETLEELLKDFDSNLLISRKTIDEATDDEFHKEWTLRMGDHIIFTMPKIAVCRSFIIKHVVHHRAQLGMYLRLNDIAVPSTYGPSADEQG